MEIKVTRSTFTDAFTLGRMFIDGRPYGYTCEDKDRHLETGGTKIPKVTAIPRGRYRVGLSFSQRFQKVLPIIDDVPQFSGVRIHGGNKATDTEGCILLGKAPTAEGVVDCAERMKNLIAMLTEAEDDGIECWLTVE